MEGFGLLCGHLVGDYVLQNDWMAANKCNPMLWNAAYDPEGHSTAYRQEVIGHLACFVHCLCYTLSVWAFSYQWMPIWGLLVCFALHFPIDRFRLAKTWMIHVSGQKGFATGPLAPWSFIIVDNVFHLVTLYIIGRICL